MFFVKKYNKKKSIELKYEIYVQKNDEFFNKMFHH